MVKYENECVGCECGCSCIGCSLKSVKHLYCDKCGNDVEDLYDLNGKEVCEDCLKEYWHRRNWEDDDD